MLNVKKLTVEFGTVFAVTLVTVALVTFLWGFIAHGENTVNWETSFTFAILFAILLTWKKAQEMQER